MSTITGKLIDSDGTSWANALWSAVPDSPSSPPVSSNGTPVAAVFGQLDATGTFSGTIPRTDQIQPAGTTLTFTIYSVTSAPPSVIPNISITSDSIDLGSLLSPLVAPPRISAAALVYAYAASEVVNQIHGNGYINTSQNQQYVFIGEQWVTISGGGLAPQIIQAPNQATAVSESAANPQNFYFWV